MRRTVTFRTVSERVGTWQNPFELADEVIQLHELNTTLPEVFAGLVNFAARKLFKPLSNDVGASSFLDIPRATSCLERYLPDGFGYIGTIFEKGINFEEGLTLNICITADGFLTNIFEYNSRYGPRSVQDVINRVLEGDICGSEPYPEILRLEETPKRSSKVSVS